jgi:hypothetical protein
MNLGNQPPHHQAFMAIAVRTAQTTWEGPLASGAFAGAKVTVTAALEPAQ